MSEPVLTQNEWALVSHYGIDFVEAVSGPITCTSYAHDPQQAACVAALALRCAGPNQTPLVTRDHVQALADLLVSTGVTTTTTHQVHELLDILDALLPPEDG